MLYIIPTTFGRELCTYVNEKLRPFEDVCTLTSVRCTNVAVVYRSDFVALVLL